MNAPAPAPGTLDLVVTGLALALIALAVIMGIGDVGPGAWVNAWQTSLTGGRAFPMATILVLSLALVVPLFVVKAFVVRIRAKQA
jgi:hypothetical protein